MLPPNWSRIPLRDGTDEAILRIVDEAVADLPDDLPRDRIPEVRLELVRRLRKAAADARKSGGLDLYLPVQQMRGVTIAASFVVSEVTLAAGADPALVLARLLADAEQSQSAAVDGSVGYRNERVARASGDEGGEYASRRVDYVLAVPEDDTRWVTVGFSTLADGDPKGAFADVLVELFDAVMTTFRRAARRGRPGPRHQRRRGPARGGGAGHGRAGAGGTGPPRRGPLTAPRCGTGRRWGTMEGPSPYATR